MIYSLGDLQWRNGQQLPPYDARPTLLGLDSLADRRVQAACTFVVSCASGLIKAQEFQGSFRVAHRERATRLANSETRLQLPTLSRSRYIENAPVSRCIRLFNKYASVLTLDMSVSACKKALRCKFMDERRSRLQLRGYLGPPP